MTITTMSSTIMKGEIGPTVTSQIIRETRNMTHLHNNKQGINTKPRKITTTHSPTITINLLE